MLIRLNYGQFSSIFKLMLLIFVSLQFEASYAGESSITKKIALRVGRAPANFIPDVEIEPEPVQQKIWLQTLLIADDAGVLNGMKNEINAWEELREWRDLWDVESTGLYYVPTATEKKSWFERMLLKYADKRLAGEVRNSEKGSALHQVGQVQKALKPKAEVDLSEHVKVKLRGKVLQGLVVVNIINPWVDSYANVTIKGDVDIHVNKRLNDLDLDAGIDYNVTDRSWLARVDRRISSEVTARISSSQKDDKMVFTESADNRVELFYRLNF
ncbi:MAG: hypothetical protein HN576_11845 [Bacteriovoracaceae bacterium]|nr:hypothetical protein [Bacteriovoracaceae bacterium]